MVNPIPARILGATLLASFLALPLAEAQEAVSLDSIKVEDDSDGKSSSVSGKYIEEKDARNLGETFQNNPEVVVGGQQRAAQKVYVRGLEDTNLNVTVDGARQAGYLFHHQTRLNIDPELLKQVDVEAGTGDALAGPGALGGSLRFVTKDAEDLLLPGEKWGSLLRARYHSNANERGGTVAVFGKPSENVSALGYITLTEAGNSTSGGGASIPYTAGKPRAGLAKISYRPTPEQKITLGSNYTSDNAVRLSRANFGGTFNSPTMDRSFETQNTSLRYDLVPSEGIHAFQAESYLADNKLENKSGGNKATFRSYGLTLRDTLGRQWWKLTIGVDGNVDTAKAQNQTREGVEKGTLFGVFAQSKFQFEKIRTGVGARFDDYKLKSIDEQNFSASHLSPNAFVGYQWTREWSSKLSWNQAFRGPVPVEAFLLANATSVAAVTDLKGTIAETTELSNKIAFEELQAVFDLSLFSTVLKSPLESSVASGVVTRRNSANDLKVEGLEAKAKKSFGAVDGNVFYTHSRTKLGGDDIGYTGNFTRGVSLGDRFGLGMQWRVPDRRVTLGWNTILVMKLTDVPSGYPNQPGYEVHDLTATWYANERLRADFAIMNILDKKYIAQGSWYASTSGNESPLYEPGRDYRLAISYQF